MKILHIIDSLGLGGTQMIVKDLFQSIPDNKDLFLFALRKREITIPINHPNVNIFPSTSKFSLKPILEIKKIIEKENIEILQPCLFRSMVFSYIVKVLFFPKIKLIFHEQGKIMVGSKPYDIFQKFAARKVDRYIAVSDAIKEKILEKTDVSPERVETIYNFTDLSLFNRQNIKWDIKEERRKLGIKDNECVIGYLGRLHEIKGPDIFIKSLKDLDFNFKALVVGDGPEMENLKKMSKDLGLEDRVIFLGYREDRVFCFSLMDIFVVPSRSEAFGISLVEAQGLDIPVITSNVGGLSEIVQDGENGLLFEKENYVELTDKIKKLFYDVDLRRKLSEKALQTVKQYDVKEYINNLFALYKELFNE